MLYTELVMSVQRCLITKQFVLHCSGSIILSTTTGRSHGLETAGLCSEPAYSSSSGAIKAVGEHSSVEVISGYTHHRHTHTYTHTQYR